MKLSKSEAGRLGALKSKETNKLKAATARKAYEATPTLCIECKDAIAYDKRRNKFCSKSCSATYNNKNGHWRYTVYDEKQEPTPTERPLIRRKVEVTVICAGCNIEFITNREGAVFCSKDCCVDKKRAERHELFYRGESSEHSAKLILIELHGHKCMECGWDKINGASGKCPVEMDHTDGNSANNNPSNLKLLCPNCHSLTPTYKALNKGKGRRNRKG